MRRVFFLLAAVGVLACQGMGPGGGQPVPADECHIGIANQMVSPVFVTTSGTTVRNLGSIPAGGSHRYAEDCQAETIHVVAHIQGLPPGSITAERLPLEGDVQYESRSEMQAVQPVAGELVWVVFRGRRVRRF